MARLGAQLLAPGKYCALDLPASSVHVTTGFSMVCSICLGVREIASLTYAGGSNGIATLPAKLVTFPFSSSDPEWTMEVKLVVQASGSEAARMQKRPITSLPSAYSANNRIYRDMGGLRFSGEAVMHTPATGAGGVNGLAFRMTIAPYGMA